ncbi:hypothetical protein SCHPADRAFT_280781 [Schizopora paradoxa]|uniref:Uncharacterized protein n=1 Tax=Schizopora paradoxa TaxID=27342 RepID=A0A0H2RSX4_9AGAM|nr:hypothetical protein SCHPADRAFT_280781 [Schizopora paradoxa]
MYFPSPLHKRQFTHPNKPIILNSLQDLIEVLDIRGLPPTPNTAVASPSESSKSETESGTVEITNGSDSETDVDNDVSDTETVVDSAPPDVTKFKLDSDPQSPAKISIPRPLERADSDTSMSSDDSPTRAFRSLVSFFHTSPRLRPPMPIKGKFISKTLKLGDYSRFQSLKAKEMDASDASDSDTPNTTPVFRRTLGPNFVSSPQHKTRTPKRKPLPVW